MADVHPCGLLRLPACLLEIILRKVGDLPFPFAVNELSLIGQHLWVNEREKQTASFASCSSLATVRVMQCLRCTWAPEPSETADGVIAKLARTARGMGLAPSDLRGEVCVDGLATNVLDCGVIFDEEERKLRAFPPVLRHALKCGMIGTLRMLVLSRERFRRLPEGMSALTELSVKECCGADECWIPESSGRRIRKLIAAGSNLARLPESMEALEGLDVSGCKHLAADGHEWLPRSSRRRVRELILGSSKLKTAPDGMEALEALTVSRAHIDEEWLPRDSRRWVKTLVAESSTVACVPEDIPVLESLELEHCKGLGSDTWLPPSSSGRLRKIIAYGTDLRRLPENLDALEYVDVDSCRDLAEDWLPESSAKHVAFVLASGSNMRKLPANMAELAFVDVSFVPNLEADFLPESSGRVLSFVSARSSHIRRLPAHMEQLVYLDVTDCGNFQAAGLPESSRKKLWALKPGMMEPSDRLRLLDEFIVVKLLTASLCSVGRSPRYVPYFYAPETYPRPSRARAPFAALLTFGLCDAWAALRELVGSAEDEAQDDETPVE